MSSKWIWLAAALLVAIVNVWLALGDGSAFAAPIHYFLAALALGFGIAVFVFETKQSNARARLIELGFSQDDVDAVIRGDLTEEDMIARLKRKQFDDAAN
ncbi:MAG: hypothetical protein AAGA24_05670 [Pseudomonadota bacterium]